MSEHLLRDVRDSAPVGTCPACDANVFAGDRFPVPVTAETELLADVQQVTLGENDIRGILGRGGMGLGYLAHDVSLDGARRDSRGWQTKPTAVDGKRHDHVPEPVRRS